MIDKFVKLGKTEILVSPIGLGVMQWGDIKLTKIDDPINSDVREVFDTCLDAGINFIDTAEIYGNGRSEIHLGRCLKEISNNVVIATKFMPFPWRLSKGELRSALANSLNRLGLTHVDLYQVHWPFPPVSIKSWMDAMADVVADGLIRAVGVSNYSPDQVQMAYETLARHQIPLASNQVKYSLLDRKPEKSGLIDLCQKMDIRVIAYSPLEKGILAGKYNPSNIPPGFRAWRYNKTYLTKIEALMQAIREIGQAHGGVSPANVVLNWLIYKGAVPIPGARNKQQAKENAGALRWQLNSEEVERLEQISDQVTQS
jgi:aryl-alcohol dehydrogenase-like predicted oxidoreductase